jgi:TetR/AcrR family transcriptional regulator, transcriptional repressor for nem operon
MNKSKKQETGARILKAAGYYFRSRGLEGTSVAEVMQAAGLTVGGFYAHFRSKEELIKKTFREMASEVKAFVGNLHGRTEKERAAAFVEIYLSQKHRDHFAKSCPIVALLNDVARENQEVRNIFAGELRSLIDQRLPFFSGDQKQAYVMTATYVGALALARATKGHEISDELLHSAKEFLLKQMEEK